MRLVCPNCAAQYEVDARAIPDDGRDVQCANCGNTWFQEPEGADTPSPVEDAPTASVQPEPPQVDQAVLDILRQEAEHDANARQGDSQSADEPEAVHEEEPNGKADNGENEFEEPKEQPSEPDEQELEPEPETDGEPEEEPQESLSLAQRARAARSNLNANKTRERRIHLSGAEDAPSEATEQRYPDKFDDTPDAADYTPAPKRQYPAQQPPSDIPDVDELNSTLRSADDSSRAKETKSNRSDRKRGGKANSFGFYFAVLIFLILLAAYVLKAQIVAALPGAAPYLDQYTDMIAQTRHMLADGMAALIETVSNLLGKYL